MTNFDFLKKEKQFSSFSDSAITAEKIINISPEACVINCRRAMEFAVKWMYSVDSALSMPYQDSLVSLMNTDEFRDILDEDLWNRIEFIRRIGNKAAHSNKKITFDQAELTLENLYIFMDFITYCYGAEPYQETTFDKELLKAKAENIPIEKNIEKEIDLKALIEENEKLKKQLTERREAQKETYVTKPLDLSEYKTRKIYIDTMLEDAGWVEGKDWLNEVELEGMPNSSGVGYADYVLYGNDGRALAVIEAKKTCVDVSKGRQQAILYAKLLEKKYNRRPVIFLTNGFEIRIIDGQYPERKVAAIYSKRDLEKLFNLRSMKTSLRNISINKNIAGRYYQEAAVKSVCEAFDEKNRRKALLVMATGSGKTRTVISLVDVLLQHGWIKNVLFLADRNSLVLQAKRSFVNLLPDLSATNLCEEKDNYNAHCVFSTYQTMMNCIDFVSDEEGKLFTCGHFDLLICDEAHRSIYNKYKDIFNYFDAPLVGLTATPKDEIEKNTYEIFQLENGVPTYGYELEQAVKDGFLVDFISVETKLKFLEEGIYYDELSDEEKKIYEDTFEDLDGQIPDRIESSALNDWVFNEDTIRKVLHILMTDGLKVDYGEKIGKTIIFAKSHNHAEKILEVFNKEYPNLNGYAMVIDNYINYAQSLIDDFSDPNKMPQIAISVDMLDTGIDVPEVLNLVFFKKVMSKAKFWQMIGRGTRLCEGLLDGKDKEKFYIFDFCGNFDFFRMNKGRATPNTIALQGAIFRLKFDIAYKLQESEYQTEELIEFRKNLVDELAKKVKELNRENFAVKQHIKYVDQFSNLDNYNYITYADTLAIREEIVSLILPDNDEVTAVRFDALLYGIELAYLVGEKYTRAKSDLFKKLAAINKVSNIPEVTAQKEFIDTILNTEYIDTAGINEFENIREKCRGLIKYIPKNERPIYMTNLADDIIESVTNDANLASDDLKNYKAKAEYYVREHQNDLVINKLKSNIPLTKVDIQQLEKILWSDIGTKQEYENEYGNTPLGEFVRNIVGLDMKAAKEAFAEYLDGTILDANQIYFVNQIVEYIVHNGVLKDMSVLQESPFNDRGSVVELFTDLNVWAGIKGVIDKINANAVA